MGHAQGASGVGDPIVILGMFRDGKGKEWESDVPNANPKQKQKHQRDKALLPHLQTYNLSSP